MVVTLAQAQEKVTQYMDAIEKVLSGQSYSIGGRSLTRADLATLESGLDFWEKRVARLTRGGIRVKGATPC